MPKRAKSKRLPPEQRHEVEVDEPIFDAGPPETAFRLDSHDAAEELAEVMGGDYLIAITDPQWAPEGRLEATEEEEGGPFLEVSARREFAFDVDGSNPEDALREPLPIATPTQKR